MQRVQNLFSGVIDSHKIKRILLSIVILVINRFGILVPLTFLGAHLGHKKKVRNAKAMFASLKNVDVYSNKANQKYQCSWEKGRNKITYCFMGWNPTCIKLDFLQVKYLVIINIEMTLPESLPQQFFWYLINYDFFFSF